MILRFATIALLLGTALPAYANDSVYTQCGPHDGYILLYKSTAKFDELSKLRCGEKVEILDRTPDYLHVKTSGGKIGWVLESDTSTDTPAESLGDEVAPHPAQPASVSSAPALVLTNQSILDMHHAHANSDAIISKIRFSACAFNTSDYALHELKVAGVSDKVVLAMLEVQKTAASPVDTHGVKVIVPGGTPVEVSLAREVYADEIHQGAIVDMRVVRDVVVNGSTIIARGASAHARVIGVKKPGTLGKPGEVAWFMQDASAVTGDAVPMVFASKQPDMIPTGKFQGYAYLMSTYGKNGTAIETRDRIYIAVVTTDTVVHVPPSVASHSAAAAPAAPATNANAANLLEQ